MTLLECVSHGSWYIADVLFRALQQTASLWTKGNVMLLFLTVFGLAIYYWFYHSWPQSFTRMRDGTCELPLPPGTMGWPYIGETLEYAIKGSHFFSSRLARHGNVYKTHLLGNPTVRVVGADHVRQVLHVQAAKVEIQWPRSIISVIGSRSLLTLKNAERVAVKKILAEVLFSPEFLSTFVPDMQAIIDAHLGQWRKRSQTEGHVLGFAACQELTIALVMNVVLGVSVTHASHAHISRDLRILVDNFFSLPIAVPGSGMWKINRARQRIVQATEKILQEKTDEEDKETTGLTAEREPANGNGRRQVVSLAKRLSQYPSMRQDRQLFMDTIFFVIIPSISSSASALCSSLMELARNSEVREKLESELNDYGLLDDVERPLTYELTQKMTYLQAFVNEVLRVHPPAGACFRLTKDTLTTGGYQIPKGWTVMVSVRETQQTSSLFPQADRFLPDRWLPLLGREEELVRLRYHFLPFGLGHYLCSGRRLALLKLHLFLLQLVRKCQLRLLNPNPEMMYIPSTRARDMLPVQVSFKAACMDDIHQQDN